MSDYTQVNDYSAKDGLTTGDPNKLIKGSDIDAELAAISVAIATKYDSADLASQAQAEAETSNLVLMTPLRVANWADANGGIVGDLQGLADPNADRILFWDDGAGSAAFLTVSTGLTLSGTNLTSDDSAIVHDSLSGFVADEHIAHSGVTLTAGTGLSGGGTIAANRTFNLDVDSLTNNIGATGAVDLDVDEIAVSNNGTTEKATAAALVTPEIGTTVTGTSDTLAETDFGKLIQYSSTGSVTITLPNGLKTGFWAVLQKTGASGTISLSATTTLNTANSLTDITTQYGVVTVFHLGSNVWTAWGSLV